MGQARFRLAHITIHLLITRTFAPIVMCVLCAVVHVGAVTLSAGTCNMPAVALLLIRE
jgi:hypothetical protein